MKWLKNIFGKSQSEHSSSISTELNTKMNQIKESGSVGAAHYTDQVDTITKLKREGKYQEAIDLLIQCVNATEEESKKANSTSVADDKFSFLSEGHSEDSWGVAPWYYEQLAIIYRKEKQYFKEVEILERYQMQKKALGSGPQKLAERLIKARELLKRHLQTAVENTLQGKK